VRVLTQNTTTETAGHFKGGLQQGFAISDGPRIGPTGEQKMNALPLSPEPILQFTTPQMRQAMDILLRAAKSPVSILITGESGTGKTVVARAIHQQSHLSAKPLITVNCPSLSRELLESELFGHVRGAFTGAVRDHWGKVKEADGGTLFLDEIGDLPLEIQPKLLRLLQEREYERVGENTIRRAQARIIAATNRDLKRRLAEGTFREDLYFRLNVISVEMPPLRERSNDVLELANHYLKHFAEQCGRNLRGFSPEAEACMRHYRWPGNLRELSNAIQRAVILARRDHIAAEDLPCELHGTYAVADNDTPQIGSLISMEKLEEMHLRKVLEQTSCLAEAAKILGIDRATLYRMRRRIGLCNS
jgi:two-component system, NtrC family, response regulator AlgB